MKSNRRLRIAIVGAGVGGVAAAVKLKQAGFNEFVVFEQSSGAGGTWYDNTYPGCEVDVASEVYSFSFMPYDWSRTHARQSELVSYVDHTIDHFGIRNHFRFDAKVTGAVWDESTHTYTVSTADGEVGQYNIVVSAVGLLNVPKYATWPGMETFPGPLFHSAEWDHSVDLTDKRVAVVGTGSTACQMVPEVAKVARHVYVFQREPGWIVPKGERDYTPEEREDFRKHPWKRKLDRWRGFRQQMQGLGNRTVGSKKNLAMQERCLRFIQEAIEDPELRALVTPDYPFGCKRLVRDSNFYPALNRPNVTLIPREVKEITPRGLVDESGGETSVDVIVTAVGFKPTEFLVSLPVVGRNGVSLQDHWAGEPTAYLGVTIPSFPNLFLLYGPNTNGGASIIAQDERAAEVLVRAAKRMNRWGYTVVDTEKSAESSFTEWVDKRNHVNWGATFAGCHNYYMSPSGRNVTQYPEGQINYWWRTRLMHHTGLQFER